VGVPFQLRTCPGIAADGVFKSRQVILFVYHLIMTAIQSVAVFCGSNFGYSPLYKKAAQDLGAELVRLKIALVYGGTTKGLMGVIADTVLGLGGQVTGIITQKLYEKGQFHAHLTHHMVCPNMRERKAKMSELSDAFIALPGGFGTFEELLEAATLTQLGEHSKACGVLNIAGFYEPLRLLMDKAIQEGFMKPQMRDTVLFEQDSALLLKALSSWQAPTVDKWIDAPVP
jgi:uncharacterized protein (TIGR00730 family)